MSDSNVPRNQPQKERSWWPFTNESKSLHNHLWDKAEQWRDNEKKYIEKLGKAKGKDVFKYLLLLNCIECEAYVTEVQLQAHKIFIWSIWIAAAGFLMIMVSVGAALVSQLMNERGLEVAYISGICGVMTTFISTIFFTLYYKSLKRMDEFHTQLRDTQKIIMSLFIGSLMKKGDQTSKALNRIIDQLMPAMYMDAATNNGHVKASTIPMAT